MVKPCWRPRVDDDASGKVDGLVWYKDLGNHLYGKFSMAVIQANNLLEDQSQLQSGPLSSCNSGPQGTFIGVYDGHAGIEASRFISHNLFSNFKALVSKQQDVSGNVIKRAFSATEEDFVSLVRKQWLNRPQIASVGSCCLVGVVCYGQLYIANAGDSRAVLGRAETGSLRVKAMQLSREHNANIESVRNELRSLHPDDSQIVVLKHKVWCVKGIIQVSRSIGDAFLKRAEFNKDPPQSKYRSAEPFHKPILSSEPSILVHKLQSEDQFLIFASDGLWEHLSNQEAVKIVQNFPRRGIAKRLAKAALKEAAKKREMRYSDFEKIKPGLRRHFHDDITVVVVFVDSHIINRSLSNSYPFTIRGGVPSPTDLHSARFSALPRTTIAKMFT